MNRLLVSSIVALGLIGTPALAADMAVKAPRPAPAPICVWCGWYVGLNVGGAWDANTHSSLSTDTPLLFSSGEFPTSLSPNPRGVIGGGQVGYNWQWSPNVLLGLEADIQGSGYKGTATVAPIPTAGATFSTSIEQHSHWFGTVRARAGFLADPNLLIYGTGGLAYGQTEVSLNTFPLGVSLSLCPIIFSCANGSSSTTRAGWTAGGGLEWMFAPHWSFKAEYLFVDLGTQSLTTPASAGGPPPPNFIASAPFREHIARGGINWHF